MFLKLNGHYFLNCKDCEQFNYWLKKVTTAFSRNFKQAMFNTKKLKLQHSTIYLHPTIWRR